MQFKTEPFAHQLAEFEQSKDVSTRALFWEQGLGKSKIFTDLVAHKYLAGDIDAALVVAPNGVHRNWVDSELPVHCSVPYEAFAYQSSKATTKRHQRALEQLLHHEGLIWVAISYEAFCTKKGKAFLYKLFDKRKVAMGLDESHYIKNTSAQRTKVLQKAGQYAPVRMIMTGTPVAAGPFDVYPQLEFISPGFWKANGFSTHTEFKAFFGRFKKIWSANAKVAYDEKTGRWQRCNGAMVNVLEGYKNLDKLEEIIRPICSRLTKEDVLDLPPKLYTKRYFPLSKEQQKDYNALRDELLIWLDSPETQPEPEASTCPQCQGKGEIEEDGFFYQCEACEPQESVDPAISVPLAIVRLVRLQQISSGYLQLEDDSLREYPDNPRLALLKEIVDSTEGKIIIWARFRKDIDLIMNAIPNTVRYDGAVNSDDRAAAKEQFQNGNAKVFVANPAAGSTGITLTAAKTVIYYSNNFRLTDRLQSEDRAHRIGQKNPVLYIDLIAEGTVDESIVENLREKRDIASQITGDNLKEWI